MQRLSLYLGFQTMVILNLLDMAILLFKLAWSYCDVYYSKTKLSWHKQRMNNLNCHPSCFTCYLKIFYEFVLCDLFLEGKGQVISKCFFGVFNFFQKNKQKQVDLRYHSYKVEFFRSFLGRIERIENTKNTFWN